MIKWKSDKYRRWIRNNCACVACGTPLHLEKENYTTHHLQLSGETPTGGVDPSDQYLVPLCLFCHNHYHRSPTEFKRINALDDEELMRDAVASLIAYIASVHGLDSTIEIITSFLLDTDGKISG